MSNIIESQHISTNGTNSDFGSNANNRSISTVFDIPYMISTAYYKSVSIFINFTIGLVKDTIVSFRDSMKSVKKKIEDNNRVMTNIYESYRRKVDPILSTMYSMNQVSEKPVIPPIKDKGKIPDESTEKDPEPPTFWQKLTTRYKEFIKKIQQIWSDSSIMKYIRSPSLEAV